ncbi:MAG: flagellar biosynthesis anti-sigma factor FlgM [Bacteriovoracaceae bacterium]|nr:flagellar biosynthesis anti-sigma factor FlgM [Bacteriovoracaceae bacterium]
MSKISPNTNRSSFFPKSKDTQPKVKSSALNPSYIQRNAPSRMKELESTTSGHAKVEIPAAVKDFARIKKAVDQAPPIDNSDKVARIKAQVQAGTYNVDYDALAEKILSSEF